MRLGDAMEMARFAGIGLGAVLVLSGGVTPALADEALTGDPAPAPTEPANVDTLPPPSQELIDQNPWVAASTAPEGQVPAGQDEPEVWAVVDENGNTLNIIVCDVDYCGSGWIPSAYEGFTPTQWARVVPQSRRNPTTGEYGGGHWGQYNFSENAWYVTESGSTYLAPTEFGAERVCVSNCGVPESPPTPNPDGTDAVDPTPITDGPATTIGSPIVTVSMSATGTLVARSSEFIGKSQLAVIATKGQSTRVWQVRANKKGAIRIAIPKQFRTWDLRITSGKQTLHRLPSA